MRNLKRSLLAIVSIIMVMSLDSGLASAEIEQAKPLSKLQQLADSMLRDIDQATWMSEGKGEQIVYIFFDPNCPFCHRLYLNTRSLVKENKLEIRWIPVGILTTTSQGKAVAILQASNPLEAFYENEDHYESGGAIDEDFAEPPTEKKLQANEALLARTMSGAVPVMLFRDVAGRPQLVFGAPPKERLNLIFSKAD